MRLKQSKQCIPICSFILGITTGVIILEVVHRHHRIGLDMFHHLKDRGIYLRNQFYDSYGLILDNNDNKPNEITPNKKLSSESAEVLVVPTKIEYKAEVPKKTKEDSRKIFINCGGTFPWSVELFYDTYADAKNYHSYSFVHGISYGSMYKRFPNHTLLNLVVSTKNHTLNKDLKCFGCGWPVSQAVSKIDIAEWIKTNVQKKDYVVVRMESEEEKSIVEHMDRSGAMAYIDKYYTTSKNDTFITFLKFTLSTSSNNVTMGTWDISKQTYSDFTSVNARSILTKGSLITNCEKPNATEHFALFLFSSRSTLNIISVIDMLHNFSPKDTLPVTAFLPLQALRSLDKTTRTHLFQTMEVGLYYDLEGGYNHTTQLHCVRELSLRNTAMAAQRIMQEQQFHMNHVMYGTGVDNGTMQRVMGEYNYKFVAPGIDITHFIDYVLAGGTITMDMTGWKAGKYLMINMDVRHSEYLALYIVRRFVPWLLEIYECT